MYRISRFHPQKGWLAVSVTQQKLLRWCPARSHCFASCCCWELLMPSVLWHCWLSIRKSIRPLKIERWGVDVVICLELGADCLHMVQLMSLASQTPSSLASFQSRLILSFWYRLTHVVLKKRPLNGCSSSSSCCCCWELVLLTLMCYDLKTFPVRPIVNIKHLVISAS